MFEQGLIEAADRIGRERGVSGAIHPADHIFQYIITHSQVSIARGRDFGALEYFEQGQKDAANVISMMAQMGHGSHARILEFAAGYGRVARHMSRFPNFVTCDIHDDAVSFLRQEIGARAISSNADPAAFNPGEKFDFIFVLSLFSHLPEALFGRWLATLCSLLRPGGHLMFTTNGEVAMGANELLDAARNSESGFTFLKYTDQPDLDFSIYGTTVVMPKYVRDYIADASCGTLVSFTQGKWWGTQDEYIIAARDTTMSRIRRKLLASISGH